MDDINVAYWLTPLLILPVSIIWRLAWKTSHPGLLMIAVQFTLIAAFEVLADCMFTIFTQDNLIDNSYSDTYLFQSFFATALQYNVFAAMLWRLFSKYKFTYDPTEWFGAKEIRFVSLLVIIAGILSIYTVVSEGGLQFTYGNAAPGELLGGEAGAWGTIALFVQLGTIYAVFCMIKGVKGNWCWHIAYCFSIILVSLFALKLLTGARAAIITLILYGLSMAALLRKNLRKYTIVASFASCLFLITFGMFSDVRITGVKRDMKDAFEHLSTGINAQISERNFAEMVSGSLRDFAWRSAGARMGSVLFADVDMRGLVGPQAVINNAFSIVPRTLWPDRPYGNSSDGSASGLATYQVSQILLGRPDTNNQSDSVSGASVAYWTLGWIGVILSGAISALVVWFITSKIWPNQPGFAWLFLVGLILGGWYVITDMGTWLGQISKFGSILLLFGVFSGILKPRFINARSSANFAKHL